MGESSAIIYPLRPLPTWRCVRPGRAEKALVFFLVSPWTAPTSERLKGARAEYVPLIELFPWFSSSLSTCLLTVAGHHFLIRNLRKDARTQDKGPENSSGVGPHASTIISIKSCLQRREAQGHSLSGGVRTSANGDSMCNVAKLPFTNFRRPPRENSGPRDCIFV